MDTIVSKLEERYKKLGGTKPIRINATAAELVELCNEREGLIDASKLIDKSIESAEFDATTVGDYAFAFCEDLSSVKGPNVTSLGTYAFFQCYGLSEIKDTDFPEVETIGQRCFYQNFYQNKGLKSVSFPKCITIDREAFYQCMLLENANFPKLKVIGNSAFLQTAIKKVTSENFPSIENIEGAAFNKCTSLQQLEINTEDIVFNGNGIFANCSSLQTVNIANYAGALPDSIFDGCTSLASASIPKISKLGGSAFRGCSSLTEASFPLVTEVSGYCFSNCTSLVSVNLPKAETIGSSCFSGCSSLSSINLPEAKTIGSTCFSGMPITTLVLPKVTTLSNAAFNSCTGLTKIKLDSLTGFSSKICNNCPHLKIFDMLGGGAISYSSAVFNNDFFGTIIMRSTTMTTLSSANVFNGTKFASGGAGGTIYVPQALIDTYSADTTWKKIIDRPNNSIAAIEGSIYEED